MDDCASFTKDGVDRLYDLSSEAIFDLRTTEVSRVPASYVCVNVYKYMCIVGCPRFQLLLKS